MGLAPGCIGQAVVVAVQLMVPMPPQLSFQEAATAPTVYVTVQTAFQQGSHFQPGTKVRCGPMQLCSPGQPILTARGPMPADLTAALLSCALMTECRSATCSASVMDTALVMHARF